MRILYINNDGGGFADYIDVEEGVTVEQFFRQRMTERRPDDYLIRVNRQPTARDQRLQEGDRISITPTKIEGALRAFCLRWTTSMFHPCPPDARRCWRGAPYFT